MSFLAPEHEDDTLSVPRDRLDDRLSEVFPALLLVRVRGALAHCKDGVK